MAETCKDCRYLLAGENLCRRRPPQVFGEPLKDGEGWHWMTAFPTMKPEVGWCGEFAPKLDS